MKVNSALCAVFIAVSSLCQAQTWSLEYGNKIDQLGYTNRWNTSERFEGVPYGPMSFRVINSKLWVLDSVSGRIFCLDENSKVLKNINMPSLKGFMLLEDFALVGDDPSNPDAVWVANASDKMIRKVSASDGKVLAQFGGFGNQPGKVIQVNRLEADAGGRLYVGDVGRKKISVFTSSGAFLREYPWQSNGFVVDRYANLHMIHYFDKAGYFYRVYSPKGQLTSSIHLGFLNNINVKLQSVDKDGSLILSMIPSTGFKGRLELIKISKFGDIIEKSDIIRPTTMNRYIHVDNNKLFVADADFDAAPVAKFVVKPFEWSKNTAVKKNHPKVKEGVEKNDK